MDWLQYHYRRAEKNINKLHIKTNTLNLVYKYFFQDLERFVMVYVNSYRNATQFRSQCQHKDNTSENKTETTSAAEPETGKTLLLFYTSEMVSDSQQNCHSVLICLWHSGTFSNIAVAQLPSAECNKILICEHSHSIMNYKSHSTLPCSPLS